jgi:hypothetical protein
MLIIYRARRAKETRKENHEAETGIKLAGDKRKILKERTENAHLRGFFHAYEPEMP